MKEYSPSGRISFPGLILAVFIVLISASVLGTIAFLISKYIYLVPLSPLILALLCGAVAGLAVRWGKIRNSIIAILIGLVLGVLAYGVYRTAEYTAALVEVAQITAVKDIQALLSQLRSSETRMDQILQGEVGQGGFPGFTEYLAQQGMTITRTGVSSSSSGVFLNRDMVYVYWALEVLAMLLIPAWMARSAARKPFCEDGKRWLKDKDFQMVGAINEAQVDTFKKSLLGGDFQTAGAILAVPPPTGGALIRMVRCGETTEQLDDDIIITATQKKGRNRTETVFTGMMSLSAYNMLWNAVQQRRAGYQQSPPPPQPPPNSGYQFDF